MLLWVVKSVFQAETILQLKAYPHQYVYVYWCAFHSQTHTCTFNGRKSRIKTINHGKLLLL